MPTRFNTRTRLLSGLLTLAMLLSVAPVSAFAADEVSGVSVNVGIGPALEAGNPTKECGGGTATFDAETNTLTLENVDLNEHTGYSIAVNVPEEMRDSVTVTIVLEGENHITGLGGIYSYGNLLITGTGTLDVTATSERAGISTEGDCTIRDTTITATGTGDAAINSFKVLTIENSTINATSDKSGICAGINSDDDRNSMGEIRLNGGRIVTTSTGSNGIYTNGDLTVTNVDLEATGSGPAIYADGNVELSGGKVTVNSSGNDGIYTNGDLTVTNVDLEATGHWVALYADGDITLTGGKAKLKAEKGYAIEGGEKLTVNNVDLQADGYRAALQARGEMELTGGKVKATAVDDRAIYADGNIKLSGGQVTAESPAGGQVTAESPAYNAIRTTGELTVENTDLTATGRGPALYADGDITLTGGKIEAESTENWAIRTNNNLSVNGGAKLHAVSQMRRAIGVGKKLNLGRAQIEAEGVNGSFFPSLENSAVIRDGYRITHLKAGMSAAAAQPMKWDENSSTGSYLHTYPYVSFRVDHQHTYSDQMGWDETYHWHKCTDPECQSDEEDAQLGKDVHQFNDEGICMICGYSSAEDSSCEDSAAAVVLVGVAVAGAAYGVYELGTRAVLRCILPEGTAIPKTKGELALLLWNEAGRPEDDPVSEVADLADIADPDMAKAVQWAVDNGVMTRNEDGTFRADKRISKIRVIRSWKEQHS